MNDISKVKLKVKSKVNFIEVCAGAGGMSSGFIKAGLECLLLNEIDSKFCETLRNNHEGVKINEGSIGSLNLTEYKGKLDILAGGIPCQSFSLAGLRKGLTDPRGQLVYDFNRLLKESEPKAFVIENVKGLLSHNNGQTIRDIIELFSNDGLYKIDYQVLNSKYYNVPQKRERVFIIGFRKDISNRDKFVFPEKSKDMVFLKDVLRDVPESKGTVYSENKKKYFRLIPPGGCWVNLPLNLQQEYMGTKMLESGGGKRGVLRRLSMDEQSLTLLTSPSQKQTERCHPTELRPLNIREYARIQTFPDSYVFSGSISSQYRQIGNAVPVLLAEKVGKEIKKILI